MDLVLLALTTAFLESPLAAYLLRGEDGFVYRLGISALLNLLTNLLLNGLWLSLLGNGWFSLLLGELVLAYLGEGLLYPLLFRGVRPGRALLTSLLTNTVSLGLGLMFHGLWGIPGLAVLCGLSGAVWLICLFQRGKP